MWNSRFFIWKKIIAVIDTAFTVAKRKPEFFSDFLFATAKDASITEMIFFHIIFHSAVLLHDFSYIHNFSRFFIHPSLYYSNLSCTIVQLYNCIYQYFKININFVLCRKTELSKVLSQISDLIYHEKPQTE